MSYAMTIERQVLRSLESGASLQMDNMPSRVMHPTLPWYSGGCFAALATALRPSSEHLVVLLFSATGQRRGLERQRDRVSL